MNELDKINAYYNGVRDGIWLYAHWKDGTQYVGTTGKTLKEALNAVEERRDKAIKDLPHRKSFDT